MLVFINEGVHLTPVTPPKSSFEVSSCKASGGASVSKLELPLLTVNEFLLTSKVLELGVFVPPVL